MKKFITGALLGGLGAIATWTSIDQKKRQALQAKVQKAVHDGEDYLTEYALTTLDVLDGVAGDYGVTVSEKARALKERVKDRLQTGDERLDRQSFDQQTADLRRALKEAKEADGKGHDIVIDQTTDATPEAPTAPEPAAPAAEKKSPATTQDVQDLNSKQDGKDPKPTKKGTKSKE